MKISIQREENGCEDLLLPFYYAGNGITDEKLLRKKCPLPNNSRIPPRG